MFLMFSGVMRPRDPISKQVRSQVNPFIQNIRNKVSIFFWALRSWAYWMLFSNGTVSSTRCIAVLEWVRNRESSSESESTRPESESESGSESIGCESESIGPESESEFESIGPESESESESESSGSESESESSGSESGSESNKIQSKSRFESRLSLDSMSPTIEKCFILTLPIIIFAEPCIDNW